jgi:AcrR family transcriptional regulator
MAKPPDTRTRILQAASRQFQVGGYQHTTLQAIAAELGLTKATILYHFPSKSHLAAELLEPFIAALESATAQAATEPAGSRAWAMIEAWLDALLDHRRTLGMLVYDLALLSRQSQYGRLLGVSGRASAIIAGPRASQRDRVRAAQALAMLGDPILFHVDADRESLRADILDGVQRLLGSDGEGHPAPAEPGHDRAGQRKHLPRAAHRAARAGRRGRPVALSAEQVRVARETYDAGAQSVDELAAGLGVSRATLYRHLRRG